MQGFHLFTFKGIPVGVQPMFFLLIVILSIGLESVSASVIFAVCAIFGVLIHEFGHALTARRFGLNPEITLCGWGGLTSHARPSNARQDFLITLMGPLAGLIVGGIFYGLKALILWTVPGVFADAEYFYVFVHYMMSVNIFWGVFNLLPIRPMDGGKIMYHLLNRFMPAAKAEKAITVCGFMLSVLLFVYGYWMHQMIVMLFAGYFGFINFGGFVAALRGDGDESVPRMKKVGIQAEALYEKGLVAARNHDWKKLEMLGHQMKLASEGKDQIERSYELLTIACTNLGKYHEALEYAVRARQSDAVKQAQARCRSLTE